MCFFPSRPQAADFVDGKFVMDDFSANGNPDYLTISGNIDKSKSEPSANVQFDLKVDVADILIKVTLSAEVAGEFKEIYKAKDFNQCKDDVEDVRKESNSGFGKFHQFSFLLTGFSEIHNGSD